MNYKVESSSLFRFPSDGVAIKAANVKDKEMAINLNPRPVRPSKNKNTQTDGDAVRGDGVQREGERLQRRAVSCSRGGRAAINPSRSQSTLKKQGLIKFLFCLSLSLPPRPLFSLLSVLDGRVEINPCRLSLAPFGG